MHKPVLLTETMSVFSFEKKQILVDATVNRGGHSKELLDRLCLGSTLICIDLDEVALLEAKEILSPLALKKKVIIHFVNDNFRNIKTILKNLEIEVVDGIIADLGVSSQELDSSERGFSFRFDEPLYMTLKSTVSEEDLTARDVVNTWSYETLSSILFSFSDERYANRIARAIVKHREETPIQSTFELIEVVRRAVPRDYLFGKTHFATKTFQAIRMAVNDELGAITTLIGSLDSILKSEGRAAIITFHSTEDRLVKHEVRQREETLTFVQKKAIMPGEQELKENPRSRSAQLRIIKRL